MYPQAAELVERVRREHFADVRTTRAEVEVVQSRDELTPSIVGSDYGWALVPCGVCDLRLAPTMHSELVSQAIFGEAIEILRSQGEWVFVRLPDGYLGWMHAGLLWRCSASAVHDWRQHGTHVLIHAMLPYYAAATGHPEQQLGLLPFGSLLHVEDEHGPFYRVRFPNQVLRWLPATGLLSLKQRPSTTLCGLQTIVGWIETMIGTPYLWGGRTSFGYDCSGLVQTIYGVLDIHLPRDADQQALLGMPVEYESITFGDLLFFDTSVSDGSLDTTVERRITHVALALQDGDFLHASFSNSGLVRGSLNKQSPWFLPTYHRRLVAARRFLP